MLGYPNSHVPSLPAEALTLQNQALGPTSQPYSAPNSTQSIYPQPLNFATASPYPTTPERRPGNHCVPGQYTPPSHRYNPALGVFTPVTYDTSRQVAQRPPYATCVITSGPTPTRLVIPPYTKIQFTQYGDIDQVLPPGATDPRIFDSHSRFPNIPCQQFPRSGQQYRHPAITHEQRSTGTNPSAQSTASKYTPPGVSATYPHPGPAKPYVYRPRYPPSHLPSTTVHHNQAAVLSQKQPPETLQNRQHIPNFTSVHQIYQPKPYSPALARALESATRLVDSSETLTSLGKIGGANTASQESQNLHTVETNPRQPKRRLSSIPLHSPLPRPFPESYERSRPRQIARIDNPRSNLSDSNLEPSEGDNLRQTEGNDFPRPRFPKLEPPGSPIFDEGYFLRQLPAVDSPQAPGQSQSGHTSSEANSPSPTIADSLRSNALQ